jgi:hypothetical protein
LGGKVTLVSIEGHQRGIKTHVDARVTSRGGQNTDEALSDDFVQKSYADKALHNDFSKIYADEVLNAKKK